MLLLNQVGSKLPATGSNFNTSNVVIKREHAGALSPSSKISIHLMLLLNFYGTYGTGVIPIDFNTSNVVIKHALPLRAYGLIWKFQYI